MPASRGWPNGSTRRWQRRRAEWAALVALGQVRCWRCRELITPDPPGTPPGRTGWHLGHVLDRAEGGSDDATAPEHALCNLRAAARRGGMAGRGVPHDGHRYPGPSRAW